MLFDYTKTYYKFLSDDLTHYGMKYKNGLNQDILPFNDDPNDSCCPGGMYFTDENNIFSFASYGNKIAFVTFPAESKIILDPDGDKWRTNEFSLVIKNFSTKIFNQIIALTDNKIKSDADFESSRIKSLGKLQSILGYADFRNAQIQSLGRLQTIFGNADFTYSKIESLGKLKFINGFADFRDSQIKDLGKLQSIGNFADFRFSQIESLGKLETIGGNAYFHSSQTNLINEAQEKNFKIKIA